MNNSRAAIRCCNLGICVLALVINLAPPLFIPLRDAFGLSYEQLGSLILANFTTQVVFDLICGGLIDRLPPKFFTLSANAFVFIGLWLLSFAESFFPQNPYYGLLLGVMVCAMGGGVLELTLSPIVNAAPSQRKTADMNMLHAYYALGQFVVVGATALAVVGCAPSRWPWIVRAWSLLPLVSGLCFASVKIPKFVSEETRQKLRNLIRTPFLLIAIVTIGLCGAAELVLAQWTSAFAEKGLGLPKITGDLLGCCVFAAMLGAGRLWMGFFGERVDLSRLLVRSAILLIGVYLVAALVPVPGIALAACAIGGLGASILWPGTLVLCARRFPLAGGSMFAALAAAGDLGGAIIPWAVGGFADLASASTRLLDVLSSWGLAHTPDQVGLRMAFLVATLCPILLVILFSRLRRHE